MPEQDNSTLSEEMEADHESHKSVHWPLLLWHLQTWTAYSCTTIEPNAYLPHNVVKYSKLITDTRDNRMADQITNVDCETNCCPSRLRAYVNS
jgi:hypothetical protein